MGWKDAPEVKAGSPAWLSAPEVSAPIQVPENAIGSVLSGARDLGAGMVRGAGSIGATLLAPIDVAKDALSGKGLSLQSNRERRTAMDDALRELVGADTNSLMYKGGKLTGEIAGTAGAGSVLAGGAKAAGAAPTIVNALRTSGMTTGAQQGALASLLTRTGAGAATGGVSAALVNPEDAGVGAVIGGAAPGVIGLAGKAGGALGKLVTGSADPATQAAAKTAQSAGYVIPPTQVKPSLLNRALEGTAGKLTTAQNASAKNATVTNAKVAAELGLPANAPITPEALKAVRQDAGQAYEAVRGAGMVTADKPYADAIAKIGQEMQGAAKSFPGLKKNEVADLVETMSKPSFDAGDAIDAIRVLRDQADGLFAKGEKGAARAYKAASEALDGALDRHLQATGADGLQAFREARSRIAKTYSAEKALNPTTGTIDARKLANQLNRGKPLSGGLKDAAEFANRFPKAAQPPEAMGSLPGISPLDVFALGGASYAADDPRYMLGLLARPAARAAVLSPMVQRGLTKSPMRLQGNEALQQLLMRSAPVALSE